MENMIFLKVGHSRISWLHPFTLLIQYIHLMHFATKLGLEAIYCPYTVPLFEQAGKSEPQHFLFHIIFLSQFLPLSNLWYLLIKEKTQIYVHVSKKIPHIYDSHEFCICSDGKLPLFILSCNCSSHTLYKKIYYSF